MKTPVIILNYNSSSDCRKCLADLKRQEGVELDIVIVDNCSPREREQESIRQLCSVEGCTLIEAEENRGYNAGNNIGLRYAIEKEYKYALIANPDMEFPQVDYVAKLVCVMEKDEQVVVCASDIATPSGSHQNPLREVCYYEELFWPITVLRNRKKKTWFLEDYTLSRYCEKVSGCCFMIRTSFVLEIGFFDEHVFLYSEEPILAKQIANSGNKAYYLSDAHAIHRHVKSEKGNTKKRMQLFMASRQYYLKNYSGYSKLQLILLKIAQLIEKLIFKISIV